MRVCRDSDVREQNDLSINETFEIGLTLLQNLGFLGLI